VFTLALLGGIGGLSFLIYVSNNEDVYDIYPEFPPENISYTDMSKMKCFTEEEKSWYVSNSSILCKSKCQEGCYSTRKKFYVKVSADVSRLVIDDDIECGSQENWTSYIRDKYNGALWMIMDPLLVDCNRKGDDVYICGFYGYPENSTFTCKGDICTTIYFASNDCNTDLAETNVLGSIGGIIVMGLIVVCIVCSLVLFFLGE
jgi:hypothetical protein